MFIYKITNRINGKVYIGQTSKTIGARFKEHVRRANLNGDYAIHRAIRKYGEENFEIKKICSCKDFEHMSKMEIIFIKKFNSTTEGHGYNMTHGGEGGRQTEEVIARMILGSKGKKHSEERKLKNSLSRKGYVVPIEVRKKISDSHKGIKLSEEHKRNIAQGQIGRKLSEEHKRKIAESQRSRTPESRLLSEETKKKISKAKSKKVYEFDMDGNLIMEHESLISVERFYGVKNTYGWMKKGFTSHNTRISYEYGKDKSKTKVSR